MRLVQIEPDRQGKSNIDSLATLFTGIPFPGQGIDHTQRFFAHFVEGSLIIGIANFFGITFQRYTLDFQYFCLGEIA